MLRHRRGAQQAVGPPFALWPPEYEPLRGEARELAARLDAERVAPHPDPAIALQRERQYMQSAELISPDAVEMELAGVPCRVFRPTGAVRGIYVDIHGGSMRVGSARNDDHRNADLCRRLGVAVVSVEYRLTPEHPYPAGPDDCFAVTRWLVEHGRAELGSDRLLIGGESAGAYFAVLVLLLARDELRRPDAFVAANLVFGYYDLGGTPSARGRRPSDVPDLMTLPAIERMFDDFLPGLTPEQRRAPHISPLYADLHGLPPALLTVGTADHFCDDSLFLASRWVAAGSPAELAVYPDCGHAFVMFPTELARRANARIEEFLEGALRE